ncbi:hypothetical protein AB0H43_30390 [Hamadaea sp. NPDC050747]|uniref:hypothetical protein n=1 Tax=Hamadaea sp. NPDC050747 TaxID=3155789 RepID=UPI0033DFDD80
MDPKLGLYLAYLVVTVALTVWVARTLFRNGQVFLKDALADEELAASVNKLLVVGFYLLNLGYVALAMKTTETVTDATGAVENLVTKLGIVMLALGAIHFFNIFVLTRFRKRIQKQNLAQLVPPHLPPGRPQHPAATAAYQPPQQGPRPPVQPQIQLQPPL